MPVQRGENEMKLTLAKAKEIMEQNDGNLDLSCSEVTSLPVGLTVKGNLYLSHTDVTSLPDGLKVEGDLDLFSTRIEKIPDNLTVGGCLDLSYTPVKKLPDNLVVGGFLDLSNTPITSLPTTLVVGGSLYLCRTEITSLPDNFVVCRCLDLSYTQIKSLPNNLVVGGWIDLKGTPIKSLPTSLMVGGNIYFSKEPVTKFYKSKFKKLNDGDFLQNHYLYADNMLTLVKVERHYGKYTYYIGKIKGQNVVFDGKNYAHCTSFKEGVNELIFKAAKDRGAEQYENFTLDSVMSAKDLIAMYRIITGACRQGTDAFVQSIKPLKDSYTIAEAIKITKGQYGAKSFKNFFTNNEKVSNKQLT